MTRHSKVFVPVRYGKWEEKENVYVLTEQELKKLILEYSKELAMYYDFAVMPDRIYEPRIEQFLKSKTNPQTNE